MGPDQRVQPMRGQDPRRMDRGRGGPMYAPQQERYLYSISLDLPSPFKGIY